MADHTEVLQKLKRSSNVTYTALTPNIEGFEGAVSTIKCRNLKKLQIIIQSDELRIPFNIGSQWSVSREIVLIKRTVRIVSGGIKQCYCTLNLAMW